MSLVTPEQRGLVNIKTREKSVHQKPDGTVTITVSKHITRAGDETYNIDEVLVCLTNRNPNVPNMVVCNLDRAIKDLTQIRDNIVDLDLYEETSYVQNNSTSSR